MRLASTKTYRLDPAGGNVGRARQTSRVRRSEAHDGGVTLGRGAVANHGILTEN